MAIYLYDIFYYNRYLYNISVNDETLTPTTSQWVALPCAMYYMVRVICRRTQSGKRHINFTRRVGRVGRGDEKKFLNVSFQGKPNVVPQQPIQYNLPIHPVTCALHIICLCILLFIHIFR